MAKYSPEIVQKICEHLKNGSGRVETCKLVGINYQTFLNWIDSKIEFLEAIKKAEEEGIGTIEETQLQKILTNESWQSAAWWLERRLPHKYALAKDKQPEEAKTEYSGTQFNIDKIEIIHTKKDENK